LALLVAPVASASAQTSIVPQAPASAEGTKPPPPSLPPEADDVGKDDNLAERVLLSPREPRCDDNGQIGGIQVCGKKKDNSKDRLPITSELNSATALGDGLPRAPDVMGNRITGHSIHFGTGGARAMMPDINFALLPLDPIGSDADRIGKGEIRGN